MQQNGIKHITSAPYHPSTNGLAERAVQIFKRAIERMPDIPIQERLSKFLFTYRLTPHSTTGVAPAELLMGRRPQARLDNLHPDLAEHVEHRQAKQKQSHDCSKPLRNFGIGDSVFAQNFTSNLPRWLAGVITEVTGPLSYVVKLTDGASVCRHVDAIRHRECNTTPASPPNVPSLPLTVSLSTPPPSETPVAEQTNPPAEDPAPPEDTAAPPDTGEPGGGTARGQATPPATPQQNAHSPTPAVRRSSRPHLPVDYWRGI